MRAGSWDAATAKLEWLARVDAPIPPALPIVARAVPSDVPLVPRGVPGTMRPGMRRCPPRAWAGLSPEPDDWTVLAATALALLLLAGVSATAVGMGLALFVARLTGLGS